MTEPLAAVRERLTERMDRASCRDCNGQNTCDFHMGFEDGFAAVLALLVPVGYFHEQAGYLGLRRPTGYEEHPQYKDWPIEVVYRIAADLLAEEG